VLAMKILVAGYMEDVVDAVLERALMGESY